MSQHARIRIAALLLKIHNGEPRLFIYSFHVKCIEHAKSCLYWTGLKHHLVMMGNCIFAAERTLAGRLIIHAYAQLCDVILNCILV